MTEITNPLPSDPGGASAQDQESSLVDGSSTMLDAGATGTDEGPAGIPAALAGVDKDGDEVAPPPAALPDADVQDTGPAAERDALSPSDTSAPQTASEGRS